MYSEIHNNNLDVPVGLIAHSFVEHGTVEGVHEAHIEWVEIGLYGSTLDHQILCYPFIQIFTDKLNELIHLEKPRKPCQY